MARNVTGPQSASATPPPELLVLRTSPPQERADAARNRSAVLEAASRLFREHGVDGVSMDTVATEAGVGKGTLFRRFGDKAGLAMALLDVREQELQESILFGHSPLGPGGSRDRASHRARLRAFVDAYLDYALQHLDLLAMSEAGGRHDIGAYRFWHQHVAFLLAGRADPAADAHTLLAPLAAAHLRAVVAELDPARVRRSARDLADAFTRRAGPAPPPQWTDRAS